MDIDNHSSYTQAGVKSVLSGTDLAKGDTYAKTILNAGSKNDMNPYFLAGKIITETNHCGGILGGITNGMPIVFRAAFKPTPSIAREQQSVNLQMMVPEKMAVTGRHDPCIVTRAAPVVEAACAVALADLLREAKGYHA